MQPVYIAALAVIIGLVAVSSTVLLLSRRVAAMGAAADSGDKILHCEAEIAVLRAAKSELEKRLAVEEQKASRLPQLEAQLGEKSRLIDALRDAKAAVERDLATATEAMSQTKVAFDTVRAELSTTISTLAAVRSENAALRAEMATLRESLSQEMKQSEAKLALLQDAKQRMTQEFKILAEDVMKGHGETFSKQNKEQMAGILTPLKESLTHFQQGLSNAHTESTRERATLVEQIRKLTEESSKMTHETHNLTRALKGKAQTQGAWGEMILSTILERSGLREGEEFVTQESRVAEDGARLRPDVVVNLPNGQRIIVDSKVSLTAFEAYVNGENDTERAAQLARHVQSLRSHIKSLSAKEYQQLTDVGLDYVIMFVPIEGALAAALMDDPALTAYAIDLNVMIATPTTLMIALRTVGNVWQVERRNRNADAIAERAGRLYDKFSGFIHDMVSLGDRLTGVQKTYGDAMGKLQNGAGNVLNQVEMLKKLGAKTSKSLPAAMLEDEQSLALEMSGGTEISKAG